MEDSDGDGYLDGKREIEISSKYADVDDPEPLKNNVTKTTLLKFQ